MIKKSTIILFASLLVFLSSCTTDKKVHEAIAKIEARLDAIEKIIKPFKQEDDSQKEAFVLPVGDSYVLGPKDAKTSIVVFSNFQCPYCAKADKYLRAVIEDAELKGKVNLVFKHFPFDRHAQSRPAALAALAAGEQDKFWPMVDKIFSNQDSLTEANLEKWAKEIGVDLPKWKSDLSAHGDKYEEQIKADIKLGSEVAHLRGTPWILVGGWLLDAEPSTENIKKLMKEKGL